MRRLFRWLVLIPLALAIVLLAVANRAPVTLSLDPFSASAPAFAITVPLFVALLLALIAGVLIGGSAAGIGRLRWRYRARRAQREADRLRAEGEAFLHSAEPPERTDASSGARQMALR